MAAPENYVHIPLEGNINPGGPKELKLYLQATTDIYKEAENLDTSVSNAKDIIDHFLSLYNKYGSGRLALMVDTDEGPMHIFWKVEQIQIADMHHQAHAYFGLKGIVNVGNQVLTNPLVV